MAKNPLKITEVVLRDAHQSLLATRMKLEHMLPIAAAIDEVGYWSVEMWGGATFDSCIRFLNEDPWDRVRQLKKVMPKTPFQMLLRGQNLVGYRHYADDLVEKFVDLSCDAGIDVFRIFDALNDLRNIKTSVDRVVKNGKHAQGTISYTVSPVHNTQMFVEMAKRIEDMGCHSVCVKDMAGLLAPYPAAELIGKIKATVKIPVHLHTHTTSGYALMSITKAIEAGVDIIDCAISPMAMGTSHSPTETIVAALAGTDRDTGIDLDKLIPVAEYFMSVRDEYSAFLSAFTGVDVNILKSQIPGGMLSNLESQLKQQNAYDKLPAVMEELPRTRKDMGYPPLVTPTSQIVGTQAVLNVLMGERFKVMSKEAKDVIAGKYGKVPGTIDPALIAKVCGDEKPITCRPADLLAPEWKGLQKEVKDKHGIEKEEDVIIFALFPQVAEKYIANRGKPPLEVFKTPASAPAPVAAPAAAPETNHFKVTVNGKNYDVTIDPLAAGASAHAAHAPHTASDGSATPLNSPLSGAIWSVEVAVGQQVNEGDTVVIIEAMKMENPVAAIRSGVIKSIAVTKGSSVQAGDELLTIG
ncbi:MAG: sodium-extruding oxaloacetate decarboxylase subunit alpha [Nitrospinae bacterium]|nr:sodium-extruding oxaloacetate decarboxylase subunit alpha [Nitrospinota bacterium]